MVAHPGAGPPRRRARPGAPSTLPLPHPHPHPTNVHLCAGCVGACLLREHADLPVPVAVHAQGWKVLFRVVVVALRCFLAWADREAEAAAAAALLSSSSHRPDGGGPDGSDDVGPTDGAGDGDSASWGAVALPSFSGFLRAWRGLPAACFLASGGSSGTGHGGGEADDGRHRVDSGDDSAASTGARSLRFPCLPVCIAGCVPPFHARGCPRLTWPSV
jgi:hypothetical protein